MIERIEKNQKGLEIIAKICEALPFGFTIIQAALGECSLDETNCVYHQKIRSNRSATNGNGEAASALCNKKTLTRLPLGMPVA